MSSIGNISFNPAVSYTEVSRTPKFENKGVSFQGNPEQEQEFKKKKSHKFLKALVLASVTIAGYLLLKKHGATIKNKLERFFGSFKNKTSEVVETAETGSKPAVQTVMTEGKPNTITFTEADVIPPTERPKINTLVKEEVVPTAPQPKEKPAEIVFSEKDIVLPEVQPKVEITSSVNSVVADVAPVIQQQAKPQTINFLEETSAAKPKKPKKKRPSRRRIIDENAYLGPNQKIGKRDKQYNRTVRHNKNEIIERKRQDEVLECY